MMESRNKRSMPLVLMQSRGGRYGEQVYLCVNGTRHYVPGAERLKAYGLRWPSDLHQVSDDVIAAFRIGGWLPNVFAERRDANTITDTGLMREYLASHLSGVGLEVGAGASPFPVPLAC